MNKSVLVPAVTAVLERAERSMVDLNLYRLSDTLFLETGDEIILYGHVASAIDYLDGYSKVYVIPVGDDMTVLSWNSLEGTPLRNASHEQAIASFLDSVNLGIGNTASD